MNFLTSKTLNNGVEMPRLGFGAVSYTHLDVYKRQNSYRGFR